MAAPPVDGKANNAEVESFLTKSIGTRRSDEVPVRGASGGEKAAIVRDGGEARVRETLSSYPF